GDGLRILLSERADAPGLREVLEDAREQESCGAAKLDISGSREKRLERPTSKDGLRRPSLQKTCALAIGPEGGWTDAELEAARKAGFREASLGGLILRTETAVIAALVAVNYEAGD